jgi:peptide/nickel transport system ATP-binding protein
MVARAFALKPKLIIADEPVSMLDASIRANVLNIMKDLKERWGICFIYITHDLSTSYYIGDRIMVMHRGRVVERGLTDEVLTNSLHPYTRLLLESIPLPDPEKRWRIKTDTFGSARTELETEETAKGCKFYSKCPWRMEKCKTETPILRAVSKSEVACFLY